MLLIVLNLETCALQTTTMVPECKIKHLCQRFTLLSIFVKPTKCAYLSVLD